jgi:uridine kinase
VAGLTALDPRENDFDNMLRCVKELKEGKSVMKPIYNHVNGTLDEDEKIEPTPIIIFEVGAHAVERRVAAARAGQGGGRPSRVSALAAHCPGASSSGY